MVIPTAQLPVYGTVPAPAAGGGDVFGVEGRGKPPSTQFHWGHTSRASLFVALGTVAVAGVVAVATLLGGSAHWIVSATDDCATFGLLGPSESLPPTVGTPIIVLGMPKAGTSTIAEYFECGNVKTSHYHCKEETYCGDCISRNMKLGSPPFSNCGEFDVYAQIEFEGEPMWLTTGRGLEEGEKCYFPQVEALDAIHAEFPRATFILNHRQKIDDWINSVNNHHDLRLRFGECDIPGLPAGAGAAGPEGDAQLRAFVASHVDRVRQFVKSHPSHKLVEVVIEDPSAGTRMEREFGVPASCWGHANDNPNSHPTGGEAAGALGGGDREKPAATLCTGETPDVIIIGHR